jgi:hypothetical protein
MRYVTVTAEELGHLREGLQVLESLNEYEEQTVEIYFYGLTDNSVLLDAVKEAVAYWAEEEVAEQDVNVTEAVLIFPASADVLYYLTGSGLTLRDGEAVYSSGGGEGPRSVYLKNAIRGGFKASAGEFKTMALSRDDMSGEDFLLQYGNKTQAAPQEVGRTEPAQAKHPMEEQRPNETGEDVAHRLHGGEPSPKPVHPGIAPPAPKKSSVQFDIDKWLR